MILIIVNVICYAMYVIQYMGQNVFQAYVGWDKRKDRGTDLS